MAPVAPVAVSMVIRGYPNFCGAALVVSQKRHACVVVVVVVEILFCIADQTGNGAQYYDGDKVTAESQGYNKQASTKERKTQKTQTANTQKEKREREKKEKERRRKHS